MMGLGRKSITLRLTLLFAATSTTILLLLGLLIASLVEKHFEELDMELLTGKLELIEHALEKIQTRQDLDRIPQQLADSLVGHHGLVVAVMEDGGRTLYLTDGAEFPESLIRSGNPEKPLPTVWKTSDNHHFRGISAPVATGSPETPPLVISIGTDTSHHEHFMASFQATLWSVVGLASLLTGLLGWVVARRGLEPLQAIKKMAVDINAHHLDQRLPTESFPVELADVADTVNDMLARLEESFRRLSEFSSDLAHELRTPVSNLLTQTQVMLSKPRASQEYEEVLASNAEELERMGRMISDMLFLAKSDNRTIVPEREQVDLAQEVRDLFEFYEALAEDQDIRLAAEGSATVAGDRLMLRRAIGNLLSNAIRYTPAHGRVEVRISVDGLETKLAVTNSGTPIAAEHLPRLFDRFYRADASRHRSGEGEGTGLGLAITRSILVAHGGDIAVRTDSDSNTFEMSLPTADSSVA